MQDNPINFSHTPCYVYWIDSALRIKACNAAWKRLIGLHEKFDVIGKTFSELPSESQPLLKILESNNQLALNKNESIVIEESIASIVLRSEKEIICDPQGNIQGLINISFELYEPQQEQLACQLVLDNLLNNMPGHIYWKNRLGVYLGCNNHQAKSLGLNLGRDVVGKTDLELPWNANVAKEFRENDLNIMSTGKGQVIEEVAQIDGRPGVMLSVKAPIRDNYNQVVGLLGISIDITDRKKAEEALRIALDQSELANRSKSEFIQNMSHDIRTPLAGILGMAQILYGNIVDENKEYAHMLVQSSERLLDLLNNVLDLASAAQENQIKQEPVELKNIAEGLKELLTPSLHPKQLQFNLKIDEQIPTVLGDANKIERILLNLLNNAIKFTEQGSITLKIETLHRKQDRIQFAMHVIDTGIGIPEDKLHRVFEEFFRVHPSYEGIYKGHGVGLYIVKKYTELMHGDVKVQSKLGVGTTFTIMLELPIVTEKRLAPISVDVETQPIHAHILLIEDEELALRAAKSILEKAGHTVTIARNLNEAHQQIKTHPFEVIVTDLGLPDGSGMDLARAYRKQEQSGHTPIFALTGHGAEVKKQCLASGIDAVFTKGKTAELLKNIQTSLSNSSDASGGDAKVIDSEHFFDLSQATELLGDEIDSMIHLWLTETLPEERAALKDAFQHKDWDKVQHHAHKLKGSSAYVGTQKLYQACKALEDCLIFGGQDREALLKKLLLCIDETKQAIEAWLKMR
jgi:two-component system, OmpR family, aerobic respiration control sensor histidine kinase ArcB